MRFAAPILLFLASACATAPPPLAPDLIVDSVVGSYARTHVIAYVGEDDWEEGAVRDTLSIEDVGGDLRFYFALVQTNFHICEMEGAGERTPEGMAAAPEAIEFGGEVATCRLTVVAESDSVRLRDEGHVCRRYYCGARAYIDGVAFPRK